jgi:hypothetical protein
MKVEKGFKIVISKAMSQDEQIQCEFFADSKFGLEDRLHAACDVLDARLLQQGKRVVEATTWIQVLPPAVRQAINATMGILYGRPGAIQELQVAKEALDHDRPTPQAVIREAGEDA